MANIVNINVILNFLLIYGRFGLPELGIQGAAVATLTSQTLMCISSLIITPIVLKQILGHKDISTTLNVYCDCFEKYEQEHMHIANEYMKANNLSVI